ncbi:MAG: ATP-binding protein [Burkholderiales bacterium]|nr:ATP-binding protein [Burkholderiales bacterium]
MASVLSAMLLSPQADDPATIEVARASLALRTGQSAASKWIIWVACAAAVLALREALDLPVLLAWALPVMAMAEVNARICTRVAAALDAATPAQLRAYQMRLWAMTLVNQSLMASTVWWFGWEDHAALAATGTALQTVYLFAALANAGTHPPTFVTGAWINLLSALVYWNLYSPMTSAVNLSVIGAGLVLTRLARQVADTFAQSVRIRFDNQALLRELAAEKRAMEEATQLKLQLLTNVSHSVRTPVSAILNMTYLALKSDLSPRQREYLRVIDECGHHLRGVVNQVLDFSKIEANMLRLNHAPFELSTVLAQALAMAEPKARAKCLPLSLELEPGTPEHLVGDPLRLTEVLLNLVSNAIKFTPRGQVRVRVQVAATDHTAERVQLRISVLDTGIGLTPAQLEQLFKRFSQVNHPDGVPGGTGLGLEITKMLVQLMGGEVGARSTPGEGSEFWCTPWLSLQNPGGAGLPARGAAAQSSDTAESTGYSSSTQ